MLANISGIFRRSNSLTFSFTCFVAFRINGGTYVFIKTETERLQNCDNIISCLLSMMFREVEIYVTICISGKLCFFGEMAKQLLLFGKKTYLLFSSRLFASRVKTWQGFKNFRFSCVTHM